MAEQSTLWIDIQRDLASAELDANRAAARVRLLSNQGDRMHPDERFDRQTTVRTMLHDCYTAMETAIERLIDAIDGDRPKGSDYHIQLVVRAATPMPGIRPAIITAEAAKDLQILRGFRHVARHVYGEFDYSRAVPNVPLAVQLVAKLRSELEVFARTMGIGP
jgi:hypothetical protein